MNGEHYLFSEDRIRKIFKLNDHVSFMALDYFQIVTLLYYINNLTQYATLRQEIEDTVCDRFEMQKTHSLKAINNAVFGCNDLPICFYKDEKDCSENEIRYYESGYHSTKPIFCRPVVYGWDIEIDLERVIKRKDSVHHIKNGMNGTECRAFSLRMNTGCCNINVFTVGCIFLSSFIGTPHTKTGVPFIPHLLRLL